MKEVGLKNLQNDSCDDLFLNMAFVYDLFLNMVFVYAQIVLSLAHQLLPQLLINLPT